MIVKDRKQNKIVRWLLLAALLVAGLSWLATEFIFFGKADDEFPDFSQENIPSLNLIIEDLDLSKLRQKREEAFKTGILITDDADRITVKLEFDDKQAEARMRLKGDWVDHLRGKKWSYRVQLKAPDTWNHLYTFSLQSPKTRGFLNEWVFHQFLEREDVLTTRYGFLNLTVNGSARGLYAWEEHFEKQLVESRRRREGPILKFSEDGLWNMRVLETRTGARFRTAEHVFNAAEIAPFRVAKTLASPPLKDGFEVGQNLMYQYKYQLAPASALFDVERIAKFLAATDLFRAYHGLIWHNQRFYYNPVSARLEPVGFDGDMGDELRTVIDEGILGLGKNPDGYYLVPSILRDPAVRRAYFKYLAQYTQDSYLDDFFGSIAEDRAYYEALIQREFPGYTHDLEALRESAAQIRTLVDENREKIDALLAE